MSVIAEIGINHNGSIEIAEQLIDVAAYAGCSGVKFQKRTPRVCVPPNQWDAEKLAPWGETMTYIDYRELMEFDFDQFTRLEARCARHGLRMFFSVWDIESLAFALSFGDELCPIKIPSAMATHAELIRLACETDRPVWLSTGMTDVKDVLMGATLIRQVGQSNGMLFHCHSAYPAPRDELNLNVIKWLKQQCDLPVGYSAHQIGTLASVWAFIVGAEVIETHITLDRSMIGSDHQSSVEPIQLAELVSHVESARRALGDGIKRVWDSEIAARDKLRWTQ